MVGQRARNHPGAVRPGHADRSQTQTGGGSAPGLALPITVYDWQVVTFLPLDDEGYSNTTVLCP